jgi:hypothetical protein
MLLRALFFPPQLVVIAPFPPRLLSLIAFSSFPPLTSPAASVLAFITAFEDPEPFALATASKGALAVAWPLPVLAFVAAVIEVGPLALVWHFVALF